MTDRKEYMKCWRAANAAHLRAYEATRDPVAGRARAKLQRLRRPAYQAAKGREYRKANPEYFKAKGKAWIAKPLNKAKASIRNIAKKAATWSYKPLVGITAEELAARIEACTNCECGITCTEDTHFGRRSRPIKGRAMHVEHCHETGRFRGLVCEACNRWIMMVEQGRTLSVTAHELLARYEAKSSAVATDKSG